MTLILFSQAVRDLVEQRWRFVLTGVGIAVSVCLFAVLWGYSTAMHQSLDRYVGGMAALRMVKGMPGGGAPGGEMPGSGMSSGGMSSGQVSGGGLLSGGGSAAGGGAAARVDTALVGEVQGWPGVRDAFPDVQLPVTVHFGGRSASTRATCYSPAQIAPEAGADAGPDADAALPAGGVVLTDAFRSELQRGESGPASPAAGDTVRLHFSTLRIQRSAAPPVSRGDVVRPVRVDAVRSGVSSLLTLQSGVLLDREACVDLYWQGAGGGSMLQYRMLGAFPAVTVVAETPAGTDAIRDRLRERGLQVWSASQVKERLATFIRLVEIGLMVLGGIAFVISGLGLANTILMNVMARTSDIGIMRTVGAKQGHVAFLFIVQGLLMGLIFGAVGTGVGVGAMTAVEALLNQYLALPTPLLLFDLSAARAALLVVAAGLLTAAIAVLPARRAAHIDPAVAVRNN
jgi:cell division protein FtsX